MYLLLVTFSRLFTSSWTLKNNKSTNTTRLRTNVDYFSSASFWFWFGMNVLYITHCIFIMTFMFLPFLMSVNCVDHFVHCYLIVLIVWMSVKVFTRLSQKALFNLKKRFKKKKSPLTLHRTIWMWRSQRLLFRVGDVLATVPLMGDCSVISRSFFFFFVVECCLGTWARRFWTISVFGERERKKSRWSDQELPHLTLFCENADTWNVSRQLLQNWLPFRNATTEPHNPPPLLPRDKYMLFTLNK